jgi:hypothetical protein
MSSSVPSVSTLRPGSEITEKLGRPGVVAGLWALVTLFYVIDQVRFPGGDDTLVSSVLYLSAAPVLAALVAAAIAGLGRRALSLAGALLLVDAVAEIVWLPTEWVGEFAGFDPHPIGVLIGLATIIASATLVYRASRRQKGSAKIVRLATLAAVIIVTTMPCMGKLDGRLMALSYQLAPRAYSDDDLSSPIDAERLWTAQPALVDRALAAVDASRTDTPRTFLVTVGAGGGQHLFGREARFARDVLGRSFRAEGRSVLLANDEESLYRAPLATNTNLDAVLGDIARKSDPAKDLVVLYLTSHGSRDAELTTILPDYSDLHAISAPRLAEALNRHGIRRRVVIVSACYSGTWIKPLASDNTIVITAARADRTSFGCSDARQLTYFGEALLKAPLPAGASLADRFELTRRTVARWEGANLHSEPQVFVGRNMSNIWKARGSSG